MPVGDAVHRRRRIRTEVTFKCSAPGSPSPDHRRSRWIAGRDCVPERPRDAPPVDTAGRAVTFDPAAPRSPSTASVDTGAHLGSISCPTTSQCTAADVASGSGKEVTFNPGSPGGAVVATVDTSSDSLAPLLAAVSCPAPSRCVGVDNHGAEITFDPTAPGSATSARVDDNAVDAGGGGLTDVSCISTSQCVAVDGATGAVVFNPGSPASTSSIFFNVRSGVGGNARISCPSAAECVVVDESGTGYVLDPTTASAPARLPLDPQGDFASFGVACPSAAGCVLVDADGSEVAFDPSAPTPAAAQIDATATLDAVACPSITQCTAVDDAGNEVTFDPHSPGSPVPHAIAGGVMLESVACPSTSECIATYAGTGNTHEITFDPVSPGTPRAVKIDSDAGRAGSAPDVACPTTSQCTAMSSFQDYTDWDTFNPNSPAIVTKGSVAQIDAGFAGDAVAGLSCPASGSCVAISVLGYEATFNPSSTSGAQVVQLPDNFGGGLACPSTSQCSTIAVQGALTFNPASPASAPPPVAAGGGGTAIACPATTFCAAAGPGGVVEGDPRPALPGRRLTPSPGRGTCRQSTVPRCSNARWSTAPAKRSRAFGREPRCLGIRVRRRSAAQPGRAKRCMSSTGCGRTVRRASAISGRTATAPGTTARRSPTPPARTIRWSQATSATPSGWLKLHITRMGTACRRRPHQLSSSPACCRAAARPRSPGRRSSARRWPRAMGHGGRPKRLHLSVAAL